MMYMGLKVVVAAEHPKRTLAADVPVTPEFRAETNEWMRSFFGTTCAVPRGQAFKIGDCVVLHPEDYRKLRTLQGATFGIA